MNRDELIEKHGNIAAAAKALGIPRQTLQSRLKKYGDHEVPGQVDHPSGGKSLSEFRATHDKSFIVPEKIRTGLRKLGADHWEYETTFAKIAGVSITDLGTFRDLFADFVVEIRRDRKRIWAGSAPMATKMRQMLV